MALSRQGVSWGRVKHAPGTLRLQALCDMQHAAATLQVMASGSPEGDVTDDSRQPSVRVPANCAEPPARESEHPTAPLGGLVTLGAAGPEDGPRVASPAMQLLPMPLIVQSESTRAGASTSVPVVIELASFLSAERVRPSGDLCQLRLRSSGSNCGEIQGFE